MEPGVVGRNMVSLANTNRARIPEFGAINGGDSERASNSTLGLGGTTTGWGGSIWNQNTSLGSGFGPATRESSRPRENGAYANGAQDTVEGKTGSGSLVPSSESDSWNMQRSPWDTTTASIHNSRSGVSPARQRAPPQSQPSQSYAEVTAPSNTFFPSSSRTNPLVQSAPSKPLLDPTIGTFSSARPVEPAATAFGGFGRFGDADALASRPEPNGSWDSNSLHSPTDDRRSVAASEYFASSATQSRSGSLPPSRHGAEPLQFTQNVDTYSRFPQPVSRGHNPSFSSQNNGRAYQERSGSIQSDSLSMFGRLSISNEADQSMAVHKPSMSVNGVPPQFSPSSQDAGFMRDTMPDMSLRQEEALNGIGSFTPDGYTNGHIGNQLQSFQFDTRSAPNGTGVRQSPYYSQTHTPPVFDHLYPSRADQVPRVVSNGNPVLVERKLRAAQMQQQQQEQQNFVNSHQFQQHQFQQILPNNQFRTPYYPYGLANHLPVNGINPGMALQTLPGMMPMEPPKAPRDHDSGESYRSVLLNEFKQNNKTSRRYELKDLYDHIVEFSGDQHGSRFIQQKLETANSDEKERVFKELQAESLQLMQDVFGNYVIQKFFEHGDQNQKRILASRMKGNVVALSIQMYACRVVQKALEHILTDQQAALVKELEKDVIRCVKDQNGNHVIQKVIERVPPEYLHNTIQAFKGQVGYLAAHTYGCRVIQRLLEHCEEPARASILQELHLEGAKLIPDQYGNYVTQHIIEHGAPEDRAKIIALVKNELAFFSKHKFASNVVEKCLVYGTDDQRRQIMLKTLEEDDRGERVLMVLLKDGYGNYVVQKLLDTLCPKDYVEFVEHLQPEMTKAKRIIPGKQIQAVEKKMHRFERFDNLPGMAQRNSVGSATISTDISAAPTPPPLVNDAQSPQSCSLPSTHSSTVGPDEPVHITTSKGYTSPHAVSIANAS